MRMVTKRFSMIVATDLEGGIGKDNSLPWSCREEYKYFIKMTCLAGNEKQNAVVMGRKTWESIPEKFKPLKNRYNCVISSTISSVGEGVGIYKSLAGCLEALDNNDMVDNVWICGGSGIYKECLASERLHRMYITTIQSTFACTVFFPSFVEHGFDVVEDSNTPQGTITESNGLQWSVKVFQKKYSPEL